MADDKWIAGLRGDMPVNEAARLALGVRLGAVRERLPAAVFQAFADIENVHQLRVSTRRAAAAMRIFADALPARVAEKTRKSLRTLRRSAGEARDWDVFLDMIHARLVKASHKHRPGYLFLLGYGRGLRDLAQQHLIEAHDAKAEKFGNCIGAVAKALEPNGKPQRTLTDLAGDVLPELLRELESSARADLQSYEALHKVRILGKQLRYAMEIFSSCFVADFRESYYPAVVEMQDILGLANDSYNAFNRLQQLRTHLMNVEPKHWPRCQAGIEALMQFHEKRLPQQRRKFQKWWKAWLKSGAEAAFADMIRGT